MTLKLFTYINQYLFKYYFFFSLGHALSLYCPALSWPFQLSSVLYLHFLGAGGRGAGYITFTWSPNCSQAFLVLVFDSGSLISSSANNLLYPRTTLLCEIPCFYVAVFSLLCFLWLCCYCVFIVIVLWICCSLSTSELSMNIMCRLTALILVLNWRIFAFRKELIK